MSTVGLVVNPTAGRGRGRTGGERTAAALRSAGHDVVDLSAPSLALAQESADAAVRGHAGRSRVDALVVVGGDGMVHLGVNAAAGTGTPLGIVAVGTGNDFAHALGLPTGRVDPCVDAVVRALTHRTTRAVDAARVTTPATGDTRATTGPGGHGPTAPPPGTAPHEASREASRVMVPRWYAGVLSAGVDAAVNAYANAATWPRGRARYARSALREIARYRPYGYRVTLAGVPDAPSTGSPPDVIAGAPLVPGAGPDGPTLVWESPGALVSVANGPRVGGGIRIAPDALVDDALLDVVLAGPFTRRGAAAIFPGMYAGRHLTNPGVGTVRARVVTIEPTAAGATPPHAFADGEHLGPLPLRVEIVPGALHVLTSTPPTA
ncbi:diacylglycerol kinase family protein [Cellulosimicrobium sp. Marseille-Q4280]|uniref:diacylglycerol/lipid kinase family protein n=1 Tax=Cellulosimicrobium sp. Marseille-Q4280 TaxID=2937992 RepID=UPI00203D6945|nr:diacylglycerol kinase family protein [Cellulosimicrobium sp. Marseille-Q4280]